MPKHPETEAIRIQTAQTSQKEHATPLFLTSSFTYDSAEDMAAAFADIYDRQSRESFNYRGCAKQPGSRGWHAGGG